MGAAIFLTVSLVSEAAPDQQILPGFNDNNNYKEVGLRLQNVNQDSPDGSMSISGGWRRDLKWSSADTIPGRQTWPSKGGQMMVERASCPFFSGLVNRQPHYTIWPNFEVNGLDWQCCLAGSSRMAPRIFIFSIVLGWFFIGLETNPCF